MEVITVAVRKLCCLILTLAVSVFLSGCGGGSKGPTTVGAKGVVKYKGEGVPNLTVVLTPEGKGMMATAKTDAKGNFVLTTNTPNDGAMAGKYKVGIKFVPDEIPAMPGFPGAPTKPPESPIPKKYSDPATSNLVVTVDKDASKNNFPLDLTD